MLSILQKPFNAFVLLLVIFIIFPFTISNFLGDGFYEKLIIFLITFTILTIIAEIVFLFLYRLYNGRKYDFIKKTPFNQLFNEPHPYLPYIQKKNFKGQMSATVDFPLYKNFHAPALSTNNLGFVNGPNGDRNIEIPKPNNLIRINCLGASTTGNHIVLNGNNHSYPLELEKILKQKTQKSLEVNNCSQGGYNSADLLVRYSLQIIDTQPDYVILYHAYNDIRPYLTPNFSSDYSHCRKNLSEEYWKFSIGSKIPSVPINFINYLTNKFLFPGNERYALLDVVSKGKINSEINFSEGLKAYERNIQSMISLSSSNNIKIILCTFCLYLYDKIKNDPLSILYKKIVTQENEIIRNLAKKNNLKLVDCYSLIPQEDENFLDICHLSPKGMNLLAKHISDSIEIS